MRTFAPSDTAGGGASSQAVNNVVDPNNNNQQQQQQQNNNDNNSNQNSNEGVLDKFKTMWQGGDKNNTGGNNNQQQQQQNQQQQNNNNNNDTNNNNAQNTNEKLDAYFARQAEGYTAGADKEAFKKALEDGDVDGIFGQITKIMSNMHRMTMQEADKIGKSYSQQAVKEAVEQSSGTFEHKQTFDKLFNDNPKLAHEAIRPVARGILNKNLKNGLTPEEAIKATVSYFEAAGKHLFTPPRGSSGGGFSDPFNPGGEDSETDFDELFTTQ